MIFHWLRGGEKNGTAGLLQMRSELCQMLDDGARAFRLGADALLGRAEPDAIRKELFALDKQINRTERQIRREIVVHAAVHGASEFPPCLVLMSIVKDAERLGDYAKNLHDLARLAPRPLEGEHHARLSALTDEVTDLLAECREALQSHDAQRAVDLIVRCKQMEVRCDEQVNRMLQHGGGDELAPTLALAYRFYKRMGAHTRNITSSVVQPLHKLDFTKKIIAGALGGEAGFDASAADKPDAETP